MLVHRDTGLIGTLSRTQAAHYIPLRQTGLKTLQNSNILGTTADPL
jgi:hypothetical protein